jgi:hypothetical protein
VKHTCSRHTECEGVYYRWLQPLYNIRLAELGLSILAGCILPLFLL